MPRWCVHADSYSLQIIDARNAWYDEMEKEINAYEEARKPKRRVVQ